MQLTEAATLDRKSGRAEGSAVRPHPSPIPGETLLSFVILRACVTFSIFSCFLHSNPLYFKPPNKAVILRVCNFIGFEKKLVLKTKGLGASKVEKSQ